MKFNQSWDHVTRIWFKSQIRSDWVNWIQQDQHSAAARFLSPDFRLQTTDSSLEPHASSPAAEQDKSKRREWNKVFKMMCTSDLRVQTSDSRLQNLDFRLQSPDFTFQTTHSRPNTSDSRLQIRDSGLQISSFRLQIPHPKLQDATSKRPPLPRYLERTCKARNPKSATPQRKIQSPTSKRHSLWGLAGLMRPMTENGAKISNLAQFCHPPSGSKILNLARFCHPSGHQKTMNLELGENIGPDSNILRAGA